MIAKLVFIAVLASARDQPQCASHASAGPGVGGGRWVQQMRVADVSTMSAFKGHEASRLVDGSSRTYWQIAAFINQWVVFDLGSSKLLGKVELRKRRPGGFKVAS